MVQDHVTPDRARDSFYWYGLPKVMDSIILTANSDHPPAFDEDKLKLYVNMSQIFSIWLVPFHVAPVTLTTVLDLTYDSDNSDATTNGDHKLYYISKQEDLYQTSEFVKFLMPHIGYWVIFVWHLIATLFCLLGVTLLWPILWLEEQHYIPVRFLRGGNLAYDMGKKIPEIKGQ